VLNSDDAPLTPTCAVTKMPRQTSGKCCLVDCTRIHPRTRRLFFLHVGRLLLAGHFVAELADKLQNFNHWVRTVRDSGQPFPELEMVLVVLLLAVGTPLLVVGRHVPQAAAFLLLFQIPTTIFFEDTSYERMDSLSVCGGLLVIAYLYLEEGLPGGFGRLGIDSRSKTPDLLQEPLLADMEEGSGVFVTREAAAGSDAARISTNDSFATEHESESEAEEL